MADVFTRRKRSEIMSKIRSKETKIEKQVFKELRKNKIHFQKHYRKAPGSPDIAIPRKKLAVFIDGDFWHGYNFNQRKNRLPKIYWRSKIEGNIVRDKKVRANLRRQGWKILRIWEHELKHSKDRALNKIFDFLK